MSSKILFTLTESNTLVGLGTHNNKGLIITSNLDGGVKHKDKIKSVKILDMFHYKNMLNTMFNHNENVQTVFITRSDLDNDTEEVETVLTITKEEYKLISKLYYD